MINSHELQSYYSAAESRISPQGALAIPAVGRILQENKDKKSPLLTKHIVEEDGNQFFEIISVYLARASSDGHDLTGMATEGETLAGTSCENKKYRLAQSAPKLGRKTRKVQL